MEKVIERIHVLEKQNVSNVQVLALVSDTSAEVIFYGVINGIRYQSNDMVEEGKLDPDIVEGFYGDITEIIRSDPQFDPAKMNIIKADTGKCQVEKEEKRCRTFKIVKE